MRLIQAPGIQVTETDRSGYNDTTDNSIVETASFFLGFSDRGTDYETKYVNSMGTFEKMFGAPTNEAERYLYNGVSETITRGGNAYVAKLPYDNEILGKYSYSTYRIENCLCSLSTPYEVVTNDFGLLSGISLFDFMVLPNIKIEYVAKLVLDGVDIGITTEQMEQIILENATGYINVLEYMEDCGIELSVISDAFQYIREYLNFPFSTKEAVDSVFYVNGKCRNDSLYMLLALQEDVEYLKQFPNVEAKTIDDNREELIKIQKIILESGKIQSLIEKFGEAKTLGYFRNYFHNLFSQVMLSTYPGGESYQNVISSIMSSYEKPELYKKYTAIRQCDHDLCSYMEIFSNPQEKTGLMEMSDLDNLLVGKTKVLSNEIRIVDISRGRYSQEANVTNQQNPMEYTGILPVVTTAANAMLVQNYIEGYKEDFGEYTPVSAIMNVFSDNLYKDDESKTETHIQCTLSGLNNDNEQCVGFIQNIGTEECVQWENETLSKTASRQFPTIDFENGHLIRKNLKKIGIVVFEMYVDSANSHKIGFAPVEAYAGELNRAAIDADTKNTTFIDTVVNTNSSRIRIFSNVSFAENKNIPLYNTDKASIFVTSNQDATSLGFYSKDMDKKISLEKSIYGAIDTIFENSKDINTFEFDILVDAGVSTIAQFISQCYKNSGRGVYDLNGSVSHLFRNGESGSTNAVRRIFGKYNDLCKNVRKDCMFIADGPRTMVLQGDQKRVRSTNPEYSMENTVLKDLKWNTGLVNTSYGAGYANWMMRKDDYGGEYFWCPPSILANGTYIHTDAYTNYWDAPAGMNRGRMNVGVVDVSFNPTNEEAGKIYNGKWNYAISYPINGIVLEGQRTFQEDKTALDRVNVRRLMLGLEKRVRRISRYFVYEGITTQMMARFVDSLTPIFEDAKSKGGIRDYIIICDERNNNVQTVENNELHCTIAVKPVKTAEFICLNLIATSQGASVEEVAASEI